MLDKDHVILVCRYDEGREQCRYLQASTNASRQFACVKPDPLVKLRIDDQVQHQSRFIVGQADNCHGLP